MHTCTTVRLLTATIKALDHAVETLWWQNTHPLTNLTADDAAVRLLKRLPRSATPAALDARERCFLGAWMATLSLFSTGDRLSHRVTGCPCDGIWDSAGRLSHRSWIWGVAP